MGVQKNGSAVLVNTVTARPWNVYTLGLCDTKVYSMSYKTCEDLEHNE